MAMSVLKVFEKYRPFRNEYVMLMFYLILEL